MRKHPQLWLATLAAILAFLAIGLRETAAAFHSHAPAALHQHDHPSGEQPHDDGHHEHESDCPLCTLVLTGYLPPAAPEPIPAPAPVAGSPQAGPGRRPTLVPPTSSLPRGPPRLPAAPRFTS